MAKDQLKPRLCRMLKGESGYGFHLHGEKGKSGQFIRKVEPGSPAEAAGLRAGDRVVEVNGLNVEQETHHQVRAGDGQGAGRAGSGARHPRAEGPGSEPPRRLGSARLQPPWAGLEGWLSPEISGPEHCRPGRCWWSLGWGGCPPKS
ncbi:hypothetical protein QYF61_009005 [Mycteria americana]|uniref:PDZ domain-containing protein n=1 Tax=Mycteria americana TaxID=33587 RepID=A0AAN7RRR8_MYCAM|nr:hypothetical protein QYF61_009005 [Mycteria americana]